MKVLCFHIKSEYSSEDAWEELERKGLELLYSSEDKLEGTLIFAHDDPSIGTVTYQTVSKITHEKIEETDWEADWKAHTDNFSEGQLTVDLRSFDPACEKTVKMYSGPGFGNLSHATTRLVMQLMPKFVEDQYVVDIGSGSGILSLAAFAMGASSVLGIEIDPKAVIHATKNAALNKFEMDVQFVLPDEVIIPVGVSSIIVLMNMIRSEQKEAWTVLPQLHRLTKKVITSGILAEDREKYLSLTSSWGWKLIEEIHEGDWLAFSFSNA